MMGNDLQIQSHNSLLFKIAICWTVFLFVFQLIFFRYYEAHQTLILLSNKSIGDLVSVIGLFGAGEVLAALVLTKENFVKFNALYTFILTVILTIGAAIMAAAMTGSFHILYFLCYLFEENGMNHISFYNFFSTIYIGLITILALTIPNKYFGKIEFKYKQLLILYFIIISVHF